MVQHYGDTDTLTGPENDSATQRYEEARAAAHRAMTSVNVIPDRPPTVAPVDLENPAYRGFRFGAAFFGWLITMSMTVLLAAAITGIGAGTTYILGYSRADAERQPGTAAITAAAVVVLLFSLAMYTGGYVAGRLARFDGMVQGFGVWMITMLGVLLAAGAVAALNTQYDLVGRVHRPNVALANNALTTGGMVTVGALVVLSLLAALLGGKTGQRYHDKIDSMLD